MRPAWQALAAHHDQVRHLHLRQFFADDPDLLEYDLLALLAAARAGDPTAATA